MKVATRPLSEKARVARVTALIQECATLADEIEPMEARRVKAFEQRRQIWDALTKLGVPRRQIAEASRCAMDDVSAGLRVLRQREGRV